jgi:acetyl esterase
MEWFHDQYLHKEEHYNNPLANPLKADTLINLPPALIILATDDILYDDGISYGNALKNHDVKVEIKEYFSVHVFFNTLGLNA